MIIARQTAVPHYRFRNLHRCLSASKLSIEVQARREGGETEVGV